MFKGMIVSYLLTGFYLAVLLLSEAKLRGFPVGAWWEQVLGIVIHTVIWPKTLPFLVEDAMELAEDEED